MTKTLGSMEHGSEGLGKGGAPGRGCQRRSVRGLSPSQVEGPIGGPHRAGEGGGQEVFEQLVVAGSVCILQVEQTHSLRFPETVGAEGEVRYAS